MRRIRLARLLQRLTDLLPRRFPVRGKNSLSAPFFIFGSGRNGSTLLGRMLNEHSQLFVPPEQFFLGNSVIKYKLYNFILWRDLMKIIAGELLPSVKGHTWDFEPNLVLKELLELESKSLDRVVDTIYRAYGKVEDETFTVWGDMTPLNTHYLPEILSVFPAARYIFLVRDGRDVVASYRKGGVEHFGELSQPEKGCDHWNRSIAAFEWLKRRCDVLTVRYEDLVADPQCELTNILQWIDLEFEEGMMSFHEHIPDQSPYSEVYHRNLQKPVFSSSVGNWENVLTEEEQSMATGKMKKGLAHFSYL